MLDTISLQIYFFTLDSSYFGFGISYLLKNFKEMIFSEHTKFIFNFYYNK